MKKLTTIKRLYIALTICLMATGILFIAWPSAGSEIIMVVLASLFIIFGIIKVTSYYSRDLFQLAFQFDLGLGVSSIIFGLVLLFDRRILITIVFGCVGFFMIVDATLKMQTAIEAKRFGIEKWWLILLAALLVATMGVLSIIKPFSAANAITVLIGICLVSDGLLNLLVVNNTVQTIRKEKESVIDVEFKGE